MAPAALREPTPRMIPSHRKEFAILLSPRLSIHALYTSCLENLVCSLMDTAPRPTKVGVAKTNKQTNKKKKKEFKVNCYCQPKLSKLLCFGIHTILICLIHNLGRIILVHFKV